MAGAVVSGLNGPSLIGRASNAGEAKRQNWQKNVKIWTRAEGMTQRKRYRTPKYGVRVRDTEQVWGEAYNVPGLLFSVSFPIVAFEHASNNCFLSLIIVGMNEWVAADTLNTKLDILSMASSWPQTNHTLSYCEMACIPPWRTVYVVRQGVYFCDY